MKANYHALSTKLVSLIQNRCLQASSSTSILPSPPCYSTLTGAPLLENSSSFTVKFLTQSCGLPLRSAISVSQNLCLDQNNTHNFQSVINFLKSHHFDNKQIASLIKKRPHFLHCRVEKNLKPKFDFLISNGFAGKLIPQLILSIPEISAHGLESMIKPWIEFLRSYIHSNEKIALSIKRFRWLSCKNLKGTVQPNIDFLIKEGVPLDRVSKLMVNSPRNLQRRHGAVVDAVNAIKILGLQPGDTMFVYAVAVRIQMNDTTWKKKIEVMMGLGWSEEETLRAFKKYPQILASSEKKIRRGMDFLLNVVESSREILCSYPHLLNFSLEKRLRPRYDVVKVLMAKNLIKKDREIVSFLLLGEKKFLENYVVKYADEVPGLLETFVSTTKTKDVDT